MILRLLNVENVVDFCRCSVWSFDGLEEDEFMGESYFDISELDCVDAIRTSWYNLRSQVSRLDCVSEKPTKVLAICKYLTKRWPCSIRYLLCAIFLE